jgi:hypothetical protein
MVLERHSELISRVFLPTCAAQDGGPTWRVFGRQGDRSRARDDEVLPQGFGGIDSGLHRSADAVAGSNRRGAAPRNSLRVRFCLDGRAPVWRWQGWRLGSMFRSWGKSNAVSTIFIGTPPPNPRGRCGLNLPDFRFDSQPNRSTFAEDNQGEKSFTTAPPSSLPSCAIPRGRRWWGEPAGLRAVGKRRGRLGWFRDRAGLRPKLIRENRKKNLFSNLYIKCKSIWIQNKFKLRTTSTHKIKFKSTSQHKGKYASA